MSLSSNILNELCAIGSIPMDMQKQFNEDLDSLSKLIENPDSINAMQRIQDAVYGVLFSLAQMGKTYPTIRFAMRRAVQQYLREGY